MNQERVREQFGPNAAAYATSHVHARGESLPLMLAAVSPQPDWLALDVATGAGHIALALAERVGRVVATDLVPEMATLSRQRARDAGLDNLDLALAEAALAPFADGAFDLVTCRLAAHHFASVEGFMRASYRVLRPGGLLAVVDNVVPGSLRRGKAAERARRAGRYVNAFDALRDPSHARCLSLDEWRQAYYEAGFRIVHQETLPMTLDFHAWTARMQVAAENVVRLEAMLRQAPEDVAAFLQPQFEGGQIHFTFLEVILVGERA